MIFEKKEGKEFSSEGHLKLGRIYSRIFMARHGSNEPNEDEQKVSAVQKKLENIPGLQIAYIPMGAGISVRLQQSILTNQEKIQGVVNALFQKLTGEEEKEIALGLANAIKDLTGYNNIKITQSEGSGEEKADLAEPLTAIKDSKEHNNNRAHGKGLKYFFALWGRNLWGNLMFWKNLVLFNPVIGIPALFTIAPVLTLISPLTTFVKTCIDYTSRRPLSIKKLDKLDLSPEIIKDSTESSLSSNTNITQLKIFNALPTAKKFDAVIDEMESDKLTVLIHNITKYKPTLWFTSSSSRILLHTLNQKAEDDTYVVTSANGKYTPGSNTKSPHKDALKEYMNGSHNVDKGLYSHVSSLLFKPVMRHNPSHSIADTAPAATIL